MAALGCPGNMAAVVSAVEPMEEYVQVVVGEDGDPSQVVVVQGAGGDLLRPVQELSPEILQSISRSDTVFYVQPDGSLVPGGSLEDVQSGVRLVTGGGLAEEEAAHHGVRIETGGPEVEAAHPELRLVTRGQMEEADQSGVSLVTGSRVLEAVQSEMRLGEVAHHGIRLVTGDQMQEADESGGHVMETVQSPVNLVTRGQVMEANHPEMILVPGGEIEETGVNLVTEGQVVEAVHSGMRLVNGGQMEEAAHLVNGGQVVVEEEFVHPGMDVVSDGGLEEEAAHPDMGMVTALNLTKEATQCSAADGGQAQETATSEVSLVSAGAPEMAPQGIMQSQLLPAGGGTTNSGLPTFSFPVPMLKDAAQQLKTVAHHVALKEGDKVARILSHKELKSIHVQVPGVQTKKSADPVVLNLSAVHMKNSSPNLLGAQVVQIKPVSESGQPLLVNSSSLESPIQILVRQAQLSAAKPRTPDLNKNSGEYLAEHRSCVAHPQNGARASCMADHAQKKGHKRKKSIKIKTRSGRISRPPKHKAKDYKFLKVGDLIQSSTSDSEDLSELSTDEEENGAKESAPRDLPPYTVKNSLFQCQTCEKSYMGKGGLSRHYRLYPSHGQMEPPFDSGAKKNGESGVGGHSLPIEPKKPTPRPRKRLLEDPLNPDNSSLPSLVTDGLEFVPVSTTCRGRRQMTGKRFGRPRKILAIASSEQNALTAKDLIPQCEDADIKEHIAPCFSERLSVYDFLLVKVKHEHPDKPLFPHLYKELEKLHSMVRILAQDYFSNSRAGTTLEVANCKVAASLGIPTEKIVEVSPPSTEEQRIQSVVENSECSVEEQMPPSKRLKLDEPESTSSTRDVTTGSAPEVHEVEPRTDPEPMGDASPCGNDTSADVTINCTEQVIETSDPNVMEEEDKSLPMITGPESIPCDDLVETSPLLRASSPESGDSTQISSECPEETQFIQEDAEEVLLRSHTDQLPCPQDTAPPTAIAEKTCSEGFQGVDTLLPPDFIASDHCTQAFAFHHGQDLVFAHCSEETVTGEAVVIYNGSESPANAQMDTVVALVEMK